MGIKKICGHHTISMSASGSGRGGCAGTECLWALFETEIRIALCRDGHRPRQSDAARATGCRGMPATTGRSKRSWHGDTAVSTPYRLIHPGPSWQCSRCPGWLLGLRPSAPWGPKKLPGQRPSCKMPASWDTPYSAAAQHNRAALALAQGWGLGICFNVNLC